MLCSLFIKLYEVNAGHFSSTFSLTLVIDLAEAIRIERLPLVTETILEVTHKEWVVNPARRHAGIVLQERKTADGEEFGDDGVVGKGKGKWHA